MLAGKDRENAKSTLFCPPTRGVLDGSQKVYVEKVYVFFRPLDRARTGGVQGCERARGMKA